jgi:hypothetical protein
VGDYFLTNTGQKEIRYNNGFTRYYDSKLSSIRGVLAQYGIGPSTFGGSVVIPHVWGETPGFMKDLDVQNFVKQALASGALPYDGGGIYNVVLPPNVILEFDGSNSVGGLAGYHYHFSTVQGLPVYYCATINPEPLSDGLRQGLWGIPLPASAMQRQIMAESHEFAETMTDPAVALGPPPHEGPPFGWLITSTGEEIGDLAPNWLGEIPIYQKDTAGYSEQYLWSNLDARYEIAAAAKTNSQCLKLDLVRRFLVSLEGA